jgi:FkbM family methyltransferase
MRIAVVTPVMKSGERGGAEAFFEGFIASLRQTAYEVDQVEVGIDERTFEGILDSYERCRSLDLKAYDLVISTKAPTYMVSHPSHICYLVHTIRVFYDMFEYEFGTGTPQLRQQRALIHELDKYGLHPERVRKYFANGTTPFARLYDVDDFWRTIPWIALHHPPALKGYREPRPGRYVFLPGRLHRWKRADLVIKAFADVRSDIHLKIAGTGEDEAGLRALAKGDSRIQFLGKVSEAELLDLYAEALVIPFVPIHEDYGLVTIEAFLSQKPVITCTDSGEPTVFVKDGKNGFIVEPAPKVLASRIDECVQNPERAAEMGRHGRAAVTHITWERTLSQILDSAPAATPPARSFPAIQSHAAGASPPSCQTLRVAVLDMQPIDPPIGGGRIRLLGLYHGLRPELPTTYLGTYDWPGEPRRQHHLSDTLEEIDIPLTGALFAAADELKERAGGRNVIDIAFPLLARHAPEFVSAARRLAAEADVLVFSHPWIYPLVKDSLGSRARRQLIVYDSQNVEGYLRATLLDDGDFGTQLVSRVLEWEYQLCHAADLVLACCHDDRLLFHKLYDVDHAKVAVAPNGTFTERTRPATETLRAQSKSKLGLGAGTTALFLGSDYSPNVEAAKFIVGRLAPALPHNTFVICGGVGTALDAPFLAKTGGNVRVTGMVSEEQKSDYLAAADMAVNPMFTGSGTNVKMLDYLAAGLPIVTTPIGARGIMSGAEEAFLIREASEFEAGVKYISANPECARALGGAARRLAENRYSWESISKSLGTLLYRWHQRLPYDPPFFSIVVATYERHGHLTELMETLTAQTFQNFEVIIIDQSADLWPDQGRYSSLLDLMYAHSKARGAVRSRNTGASYARGRVIAFTDDDCRPFPDWLENARRRLQDPTVVGIEGLIVSDRRDDPEYRAVTNIDFEGIGFMTANLFIRREAFMQLDGFDLQFDHPHFREDTDLGWRALELGKIPFGHEVRVYHPPHRREIAREGSAVRNRFFEKDALLLRKHPERYRDLFLKEGHYLRNPGFRENFLRGLEKYKVQADPFYLSLLDAAPTESSRDQTRAQPMDSSADHRLKSLLDSFRSLLDSAEAIDAGRQLNPVDGFFAYRLLLGRNPDDNGELTNLLTNQETYRQFLSRVIDSPEFEGSGGLLPPNRLLMGQSESFRFWFNTSDREMGVKMGLGLYEPRCVALIKRLVKKGMSCLDLGAQTGFYTCLLASLVGESGHVDAFEPMPASFELLVRNVQENKFEKIVTSHPLGVSDTGRIVEGSLVSKMFVGGRIRGAETASFRCVAVDDVIEGPIDFIKIDVEGHEPLALRGMRSLLRACQPVILSEVNDFWLRACANTSARQYVDALIDLDYEVYSINNLAEKIPPASLSLDELALIDVLALPPRLHLASNRELAERLATIV